MEQYDPMARTRAAVLIVLLVLVSFLVIQQRPEPVPASPTQSTPILIATPTLGLLPILPTPAPVYIEQPAPVEIRDNSVNVCIGYCPDAR